MRAFRIIALAAIFPLAAVAQMVTFDFTGSITQLIEHVPGGSGSSNLATESDYFGYAWAHGVQVTGSFGYDLSAAPDVLPENVSGDYGRRFHGTGWLSFTIPSLGYTHTATADEILLANDSTQNSDGPDVMIMTMELEDSEGNLVETSMNFRDGTGLAFNSNTVLPATLDLAAFTYEGLFLNLEEPVYNGAGLGMVFTLTDLELAAVPEPASVAAWSAAGVLATVVFLRRKRRKSAMESMETTVG